MGKIKGWKKKVSTSQRHYWEHTNGMIANVEKVGAYWTFTKGSLKGKQESVTYQSKKPAMDRAIYYMKFHNYNPKNNNSGDGRDNYMFEGDLF